MSPGRDDIIDAFRELAELTALDEGSPQAFRVRAYDNAARALESAAGDLAGLTEAQLEQLDGIGQSTARKIRELCTTGKIKKLEALREKYPPAYVQLSRLPGLGPKAVARLRAELGVHSLDDLRAALEAQKLRRLKGFGAKTEEKLKTALRRLGLGAGKQRRTPIAEALPIARRVVAALGALPGVERVEPCGSLRRLCETVGDIDIIVAAAEPAEVMDAFVALPLVADVLVRGDTKTSVVTRAGLQIDLRVVQALQYGAATLYFTGSKAHNIKLRQRAGARGLSLNEYGLTDIGTARVIASETEEAVYRALELPWLPPVMREDNGEIEAALAGTLPGDIPKLAGDLHVHTDLSGDGRSSLGDMLARAAELGYRYLAITEHAEDLAQNGVSRAKLRDQARTLRRLQPQYPELTLLCGAELNIGPQGQLDYDASFRGELDFCLAAIHSHFELSRAQQTDRILAAMADPAVNMIGHTSCRLIGRRPEIELDWDAVFKGAVETGTAIEINGALPRLDPPAQVLRRARELPVVFAICTDAHQAAELSRRAATGALHARRGWVEPARLVNTWPSAQLLSWIARKRRGLA